MLRGLYIAATGMLTQRKRMDVVTNNLTNVDTVGYKREEVITSSFDDVLTIRMRDGYSPLQNRQVGPLTYGAYVSELVTDHSAGSMDVTNRNADMAIAGEGYFVVLTPNGERYTRAGDFTVNQQGWLLTNEGYFVMGENGPINVGTEDNFSVNANGDIYVDGQYADTLLLVDFEDNTMLRKDGENLYSNPLGAGMINAEGQVQQGMLEMSNAILGDEMTDMLQLYRVYEANQRMVQTVDRTLEKTCNEIGRV